jgi:hypothetical protein
VSPEYQYVWLLWSSAFLVPWALVCLWAPSRARMLRVSAATSLLGLTEPIFVPRYWNPPSLFDLASRTGFDLESLVFCFAIGGIASVLYDALARHEPRPLPRAERDLARHRLHALALGAGANVLCRPDLGRKTLLGGALFLGLYALFMIGLVVFAPGYIERVWNLPELSGVLIAGIPLEELAFGFAFGMYWAGLYEHFSWHAAVSPGLPIGRWSMAALLASGAILGTPRGAAAEEETFRKTAGDYSLVLAVMPAEVIRGPAAPEIPGASLQRAPAARDTHHVMVSIFDARSGQRLERLQVKARVAALGFSGEKRDLEPISVGGAKVYGNTFPMLGRGPFRVDVEVNAHGGPHAQRATFYFTHPSFAAPKPDAKPGEGK